MKTHLIVVSKNDLKKAGEKIQELEITVLCQKTLIDKLEKKIAELEKTNATTTNPSSK